MQGASRARGGWMAAMATIGLFASALSGPASATPESSLVTTGCHETVALIHVPWKKVRAVVPRRYEPLKAENSLGEELGEVFLRTGRCESTSLDDTFSGPSILDHVSITIKKPGSEPAGTNGLDVYALEMATSNGQMRDWLLGSAPGYPIWLAVGMTFDHHPVLGNDPAFHAKSPAPAPSPREWRASTLEPSQENRGPAVLRLWNDLPNGNAALVTVDFVFSPGHAEGTVTTQRGTPLANLLGATQAEYSTSESIQNLDIGLHQTHDSRLTKTIIRPEEFPK